MKNFLPQIKKIQAFFRGKLVRKKHIFKKTIINDI